ncbi:TIGR01244 family sulfur transferase [Chelativorans sp. Marseille-P2723]|uniref:TIGR01244 family sulfur transferase n=1 Tax=Chelativorans sp. Marseille-P2723 TaxID=2709133 RepID=UPI001FED4E51|nr:TIGR01244 family sulfur transferase [Chelativorans sp. Marseille-P2723]
MKPVQIDERLAVCGQISPQDISGLAQAGYATIVNNRPDGEGFLQPTASAIADAAEKAGLRSAHLPVRGPDITEQLVRDFQKTLAESAGPVVAFCRSGTRSLTLWAIGGSSTAGWPRPTSCSSEPGMVSICPEAWPGSPHMAASTFIQEQHAEREFPWHRNPK